MSPPYCYSSIQKGLTVSTAPQPPAFFTLSLPCFYDGASGTLSHRPFSVIPAPPPCASAHVPCNSDSLFSCLHNGSPHSGLSLTGFWHFPPRPTPLRRRLPPSALPSWNRKSQGCDTTSLPPTWHAAGLRSLREII